MKTNHSFVFCITTPIYVFFFKREFSAFKHLFNISRYRCILFLGCQKSYWGSDCELLCPDNCIEQNCFPQNGSCVWGCNANNCLSDICDQDTSVCTNGCKHRRTGIYCNNCKYLCASTDSYFTILKFFLQWKIILLTCLKGQV